LRWLADNQLSDGSWGSSVRYEHDRILCTLASLAPLAEFGRRAEDRRAVEAGTRYLWQHGHLIGHEPVELVGFELLLPALVDRARAAPMRDVRAAVGGVPPVPRRRREPALAPPARTPTTPGRCAASWRQPVAHLPHPGRRRYRGRAAAPARPGRTGRPTGLEG